MTTKTFGKEVVSDIIKIEYVVVVSSYSSRNKLHDMATRGYLVR